MLKVNKENYTSWDYTPYMKRGVQIEKPKDTTYEIGHVVYVAKDNAIGVVLGCIDEHFDGEVRVDMDGMTSIDEIRFATIKDFEIKDVRYVARLLDEIKSNNVSNKDENVNHKN